MGKFIIYFKENRNGHCAYRFVKSYRKGGFLRKERIEYTLDLVQAMDFPDMEVVVKAHKRLSADYPDAAVNYMDVEEFRDRFALHRFWLICRHDNNGQPIEYYSGTGKGHFSWTNDITNALLGLDAKTQEETFRRIRLTGDRITLIPVYLDLINDLMNPNFIITCTSKTGEQKTKFFARREGNRLRLVETSDAAKKFNYREGLEAFETLKINNKNFLYAMLPAFKENVSYKNLEAYCKTNNPSRALQMEIKLNALNK